MYTKTMAEREDREEREKRAKVDQYRVMLMQQIESDEMYKHSVRRGDQDEGEEGGSWVMGGRDELEGWIGWCDLWVYVCLECFCSHLSSHLIFCNFHSLLSPSLSTHRCQPPPALDPRRSSTDSHARQDDQRADCQGHQRAVSE